MFRMLGLIDSKNKLNGFKVPKFSALHHGSSFSVLKNLKLLRF